jgi:uridine phosphorylase
VPNYLRPTAGIAACALLPGDPGRALALAQELLKKPLMSNHSRGLWGYTGHTQAGLELTIQSTGIGGPSAAAVLRELVPLGVRRAVRVGTCRAVDPGLEVGELLVVDSARALDGTSRSLGSKGEHRGDESMLAALRKGVRDASSAVVASVDVMPSVAGGWDLDGAHAVDLATAPLFVQGEELGVEIAAVLVVTESADGTGAPDEHVERRTIEAGRAAAVALSAP